MLIAYVMLFHLIEFWHEVWMKRYHVLEENLGDGLWCTLSIHNHICPC